MMVRMRWKHITSDGIEQGAGPWSKQRARTVKAVAFGNRYYGPGSHWVEEMG